jgi:hypothetical protein
VPPLFEWYLIEIRAKYLEADVVRAGVEVLANPCAHGLLIAVRDECVA